MAEHIINGTDFSHFPEEQPLHTIPVGYFNLEVMPGLTEEKMETLRPGGNINTFLLFISHIASIGAHEKQAIEEYFHKQQPFQSEGYKGLQTIAELLSDQYIQNQEGNLLVRGWQLTKQGNLLGTIRIRNDFDVTMIQEESIPGIRHDIRNPIQAISGPAEAYFSLAKRGINASDLLGTFQKGIIDLDKFLLNIAAEMSQLYPTEHISSKDFLILINNKGPLPEPFYKLEKPIKGDIVYANYWLNRLLHVIKDNAANGILLRTNQQAKLFGGTGVGIRTHKKILEEKYGGQLEIHNWKKDEFPDITEGFAMKAQEITGDDKNFLEISFIDTGVGIPEDFSIGTSQWKTSQDNIPPEDRGGCIVTVKLPLQTAEG